MSVTPPTALALRGLTVSLKRGDAVISEVNLTLAAGEIVCLVGESGSGKTTTALSAFGYTPSGLSTTAGQVAVDGAILRSPREFARVRGSKVAYVPQNPGTALNPSMRIRDALLDAVGGHPPAGTGPTEFALAMLERVGLPGSLEFAHRFPHQLSGGQQQRVCIAFALASSPSVVVLDEPTTGLDVVTQAKILTELLRLRDDESVAMLYVTHDLAVAADVADRIVVMYGGEIVEDGPGDEVLRRPRHPYTRGLMASTPDHSRVRKLEVMPGGPMDISARPGGCCFEPRCAVSVASCRTVHPGLEQVAQVHEVRCPEWQRTEPIDWSAPPARGERGQDFTLQPAALDVRDLSAEHRARGQRLVVAQGISFSLSRGACVALVGESGSGKTTIARALAGLHPAWSGEVLLDGTAVAPAVRARTPEQRRRLQMVFQNPADALNPRQTVEEALARPSRILRGLTKAAASKEVRDLLEAVRLPQGYANRFPRELSGGQRQRVAIARALAAHPDVIICDEVTSALDVSVQARILELLGDLRRDRGVALLFITHDLGVVAAIADEVLVLREGIICEAGATSALLEAPRESYTKQLLDAAPSLSSAIGAWDARDSAGRPEAGRA